MAVTPGSTVVGEGSRRQEWKRTGSTSRSEDKDDWANVEPDEVFRRLPVNEVRRVEGKMRSDALNKQAELRSMVGTRYRDLLTSASQITSIHSSSLRLSQSLREVANTCANPDINVNVEEDNEGSAEEEDVVNLLPVAAHMKLLLDAPEALYAYLAQESFLQAAFLWLISRVVKESLSSLPADRTTAYMPLLRKQWEVLLPFRGQIVQRATASLRSTDKLEPKVVSETLLSVVLLDNVTVSEALALFLSQRSKALQEALQYRAEPTKRRSSLLSEGTATRKRSESRVQAGAASREAAHERESISKNLTAAVTAILETRSAVQAVFNKRKESRMLDGESVLDEMIRLVQKGEVAPQSSQPPPVRRTSHQRRASRLASISMPVPRSSPGVDRPPVSATQIIQSLPSSQILLRHLPSSITGFTPFIAPSSTPSLADKLVEWQKSALSILQDAVPSWLAGLRSVTDIWSVRTALSQVLMEGELESSIKGALEDQWGRGVQEVWDEKLAELVSLAETETKEAGDKIRNGGEAVDTDMAAFLFMDLTYPSAPASTLATSSSSTIFDTFRSTIKKRIACRTGSLDGVLVTLESFAAAMKADMQGLPATLQVVYGDKVLNALSDLVQVLQKVLDSMGAERGDGKAGIEAELFVGRVALYLAKSSPFMADLVVPADENATDGVKTALLAVHAKSTAEWRNHAVQEAVLHLAPLFEPFRDQFAIKASWQGAEPTNPSHPVMSALQSLVASVQKLGIPPSIKLPVTAELVTAFATAAKALDGWSTAVPEAAAQTAVDLAFVVRLDGVQSPAGDATVKQYLGQASSSYPSLPGRIDAIVDQALRRTQLLLHPLLSHQVTAQSAPLGKSYNLDARNAALLRFGAPSGGAGGAAAEYKSPVVIAKPGKRMGLLSIAA